MINGIMNYYIWGAAPNPGYFFLNAQNKVPKKNAPRRLFLNGMIQACPLN